MPKIAFSTLACPTWNWEQVLTAGVNYGYDGIEIRQIAGQTDLLSVPELRPSQRASRRSELKRGNCVICGLASSVRFDYPEQEKRAEQLHIGMAYVELAAELEATFVRVFGDVLPPGATPAERTATLDRIAEGLNQLGDFASRHKIDVVLETHGDFAETALVVELSRRFASPAVGVLWDTHHPWRFFNEPLAQTCSQLAPWVRHTHWKDSITRVRSQTHSVQASAKEQEAHALMSGHRRAEYVLFGGGEFPIEECVGLLKQAGYDGWLSLEWEQMWHPELEDPEVALPLFPPKMHSYWQHSSSASGPSAVFP